MNCFRDYDTMVSEDVHHWTGILLSQLQSQALPTVCAVVTATTYAPEHGICSAIMAASVASMGCSGSVLAGLLCGRIVSFLVSLCFLFVSTLLLSYGPITMFRCSNRINQLTIKYMIRSFLFS